MSETSPHTPAGAQPAENEGLCRYLVPVNGADPIIHLFLTEENRPNLYPRTGLTANTLVQAHAFRPQDGSPVTVTLSSQAATGTQCKFWEIDRNLMPGLYGLQIPVALRPTGITYLYFSFPGTQSHYVQIQGVGYDPYDPFAMGLETWIRSSCHENLSSGLRKSMPSVLRPLLAEWLANPTGG